MLYKRLSLLILSLLKKDTNSRSKISISDQSLLSPDVDSENDPEMFLYYEILK